MYRHVLETKGVNATYAGLNVARLNRPLIDGLLEQGFIGLTITMPYKAKILRYTHQQSKEVREIGAANTILNTKGSLKAFNTDWLGALDSLKAATSLKRKKVLLLGAGDVAKAIIYGLIKENVEVCVVNRTPNKARSLSNYFGCEYATLAALKKIDYDILINATSVGYRSSSRTRVIEPTLIRAGSVVLDVVFDPIETQLIKDARSRGCKICTGLDMLIRQAQHQFEVFFGQAPEYHIFKAGYPIGRLKS